jgi:hypothetical protein
VRISFSVELDHCILRLEGALAVYSPSERPAAGGSGQALPASLRDRFEGSLAACIRRLLPRDFRNSPRIRLQTTREVRSWVLARNGNPTIR